MRRDGDVRRREADGAPDLLALFDAPRNAVAASEQVVDLVHIPLRKQAADARGRYRFAVNHHFRHNHRAETVLLAVLLEHLSIAFAARAEGEIEAAHDYNRCVHLHQFRHKILRRLIGARPCKRRHAQPVHAEGLHDRCLFRQRRQHHRFFLRRKHMQRVWLEGADRQRIHHLLRQLVSAHQQRLMAAVHAVKHPQHQHAGIQALRVTDDSHCSPPSPAGAGISRRGIPLPAPPSPRIRPADTRV